MEFSYIILPSIVGSKLSMLKNKVLGNEHKKGKGYAIDIYSRRYTDSVNKKL